MPTDPNSGPTSDLPRITRLDELADLIETTDGLYLRWSRGPKAEPLVRCHEAIAWVDQRAVEEATRLIDEQQGDWGPLDRARVRAQNA